MKTLLSMLACSLLLVVSCLAQDNNIGAGGISYQPGDAPSIAGSGMFLKATSSETDPAKDISNYAFSWVDILPLTIKPFTVTTSIGLGDAVKIVTIAGVPLYAITGAGLSVQGTNSGWAWSAGGFAKFRISIKGQETHWRILPSVRMVKSSVAAGQGYSLIGGAMIGWGWQ